MRNLKRALSLTLASVMLLGMMIVGSSAASFNDADDIENVTAATILQELKIMQGSNGNFAPNETVTRGQMAIIICKMLYGDKLSVSQFADTQQFDDVPAGQYYTGYVNLASNLGIISGYGNGNFGPGDPITTAQAALMLTRALGYYKNNELAGQGWAQNALTATTLATRLDIFNGLNLGVNDPLSRDNVCAMTFNTMTRATPVKFNNILNEYYTDGLGVTSGVAYIDAYEHGKPNYEGNEYRYTLGYTNYGLYISKDHDVDDFGRPSDEWSYEAGGIIGSFANEPVKTFTSKVTSKALYDAIGKTAVDSYDTFRVSINGDPVLSYTAAQLNTNKNDTNDDFYKKTGGAKITTNGNEIDALTGNGVITEVYVDGTDKNNRRIDVVCYDVYAAEVYDVKSDGKITLADLVSGPASRSDEYAATGFAEDDIVVYTYANGKIQSVAPATKLEGKVVRVSAKTSDREGNNFRVEGDTTDYKYNRVVDEGWLTTNNVNNQVVAYLDTNGYVSYIDESAVTYDYAYLLSANEEADKYGSEKTTYARLVLTDGTILKVDTDADEGTFVSGGETVNMIVAYSVDKNNIYTLTQKDYNDSKTTKGTATKGNTGLVAPGVTGTAGSYSYTQTDIFKNGNAVFTTGAGTFTANSNTIVIVADSADKLDDYSFTVYTGVKNIPDIATKALHMDATAGHNVPTTYIDVAADENNVAKIVYVQDADVSGNGNVIYLRADAKADVVKEISGYKCYEIKAVVDGKVQTLLVKEGTSAYEALVNYNSTNEINPTGAKFGDWVELKADEKYIVAAKSITTNNDGVVTNIKFFDALNSSGDGVKASTTDAIGTKKDITSSKDVAYLGTGSYPVDNNTLVVRWNVADGAFTVDSVSRIKKDGNDEWVAVADGYTLDGLCIVEHEGAGASAEDMHDITAHTNGAVFCLTKGGSYTASLAGVEKGTTVYVRTSSSSKVIDVAGTSAVTLAAVAGETNIYSFAMPNSDVAADAVKTKANENRELLVTNPSAKTLKVSKDNADSKAITTPEGIAAILNYLQNDLGLSMASTNAVTESSGTYSFKTATIVSGYEIAGDTYTWDSSSAKGNYVEFKLDNKDVKGVIDDKLDSVGATGSTAFLKANEAAQTSPVTISSYQIQASDAGKEYVSGYTTWAAGTVSAEGGTTTNTGAPAANLSAAKGASSKTYVKKDDTVTITLTVSTAATTGTTVIKASAGTITAGGEMGVVAKDATHDVTIKIGTVGTSAYTINLTVADKT